MSSGGGKQASTTTVQKSDPPSWAIPYFQSALGKASDIANQPYQQYQGPRMSDFTGDQYAGFDMVRQQAAAGQPMMQAGNDYITRQLQGGNQFNAEQNPYAGQNPYLDESIANAQSDVVNQYNKSVVPGMLTQFQTGGAFGGTAMNEALQGSQGQLASQLGRISTDMRNTDYDRQAQLADSYLGRKQSAWAQNNSNSLGALGQIQGLNSTKYDDAKALMNIGQQQQNWLNQLYDTGYQDYQDSQNWDANRLGTLTNALGAIQGGQSTNTGTGANPNYRSAGQNAGTYAAILASLWG